MLPAAGWFGLRVSDVGVLRALATAKESSGWALQYAAADLQADREVVQRAAPEHFWSLGLRA